MIARVSSAPPYSPSHPSLCPIRTVAAVKARVSTEGEEGAASWAGVISFQAGLVSGLLCHWVPCPVPDSDALSKLPLIMMAAAQGSTCQLSLLSARCLLAEVGRLDY